MIELLDEYLLIHFGMSGRLIVAQNELEMRKVTHSLNHIHLCLDFNDFCILYQDPRRFGSVRTVSKEGPKTTGQLSTFLGIGFEPLSEKFGTKELFYITRGISRQIKIFLMDGKKIAGIGNIYATEALFRAGIRPTLPCLKLSIAKCSQLVSCLKSVLLKAISKGGSSLRDFYGLSGERGSFIDEHLVYGKKENCVICNSRFAAHEYWSKNHYILPSLPTMKNLLIGSSNGESKRVERVFLGKIKLMEIMTPTKSGFLK